MRGQGAVAHSALRSLGMPETEPVAVAEATAAGLLLLFLASLLLPISFEVAGLHLTPARIFLLVSFVPLMVRWLSGAAGRVTVGDIFFGLHGAWIGIAMFAVHGSSRIAYTGISIVEVLGSYLVGRVLIRNLTDYRTFFRYLLIGLALLAPFVILENLTGRLYFSELLDPIAATHQKVQAGAADMRMGLYRAQGVVDHPILWGVLCSIGIANAYYLFRSPQVRRLMLTGFATAMTFTSLSSGPLLAAALQLGMISWGWITRNAWWVLAGLIVSAYVGIDLVSNRSPVQVLISHLTFSPRNAYWRLHIWDFGSAEVLRHPLFGIGLNDWVRPDWLSSASVDNFWLNTAMRFGFPGILLLLGGIAANLIHILSMKLPEDLRMARSGHVIALLGTLLVLSTVHVWGSTAVLILFYFGAGSWLVTGQVPAETEAAPVPAPKRALRRAPRPRDAEPPPAPAAMPAAPPRHRIPTKAERLARRRAQYSRPRSL